MNHLYGKGWRPRTKGDQVSNMKSYGSNSVKFFTLGMLAEVAWGFCCWVFERFNIFQYSVTMRFHGDDPSCEWMILLLTEAKLWERSPNFLISTSPSAHKYSIDPGRPRMYDKAEYVPTYKGPQLFFWKGYWVEFERTKGTLIGEGEAGLIFMPDLYLTMYTTHMHVLSALVEEARQIYLKIYQRQIIVHKIDEADSGEYPHFETKLMPRHPLQSISLPEGVIQSILDDVCEFLDSQEWYSMVGIPHRRGYLLHGPPGTGKSSTIYALAGELGMEISSISLASTTVTDSILEQAVACIPKHSIFLIEAIDCAFPSREQYEEISDRLGPGEAVQNRSSVTTAGILNILDGVGSREGVIFFATANSPDQLDPALIRPGRIDLKIQYHLATQAQAESLFISFYSRSQATLLSGRPASMEAFQNDEKGSDLSAVASEKEAAIKLLAVNFASQVPEYEFSPAEIQGYLLAHKTTPERAVEGISAWVDQERKERYEIIAKEETRKARLKEKREANVSQLKTSLSMLQEISFEENGGNSSD